MGMIKDKELYREIGANCACFNLRRAARLITQRYERALKVTGLKATQFSVLVAASYTDGLLLTRMARLLGLDRTSLTRNLEVMAARGLVTLKAGDDKRGRQISITPKGRAALAGALPLWEKVQAEVVDALGPERWASLLSGLHEVARKA